MRANIAGKKEALIAVLDKKPSNQEDPLSVFMYALKAPETKRQYPRRAKVFFDFLKLNEPLEEQAKDFLSKAKQNPQWAQSSLMQFIAFQKERARAGEIAYSTISNYFVGCLHLHLLEPWSENL